MGKTHANADRFFLLFRTLLCLSNLFGNLPCIIMASHALHYRDLGPRTWQLVKETS